MKITVLVENTSAAADCGCEHGLSLHIETRGRRILFDTGAGPLFAENAKKLNVDLEAVDLAVISHGHSDHGGGLRTFLQINETAPVYLERRAFGDYYVCADGREKYAGLDPSLRDEGERFVYTEGRCVPAEGLELFSGVAGRRPIPSGNGTLFEKTGDGFRPDRFAHEQNLAIEEDGKVVLIAGCAHCGVTNILEHFRESRGFMPTHVIGGFHFHNPTTGENEDPETVAEVGQFLLDTGAKYYTGHCTGSESCAVLRSVMGDRLGLLSTGLVLTL